MNSQPPAAAAASTHDGRAALASARIANLLILLAIIGLVLALRLPALIRSEINMDDSNFLTMGRELMRGATPYVDFWDHNPLGGVALFGVAGRLLGYSYVTLRWLTMAAVVAQCFLLYLIAARLAGGSRVAGIIAAATYAVYSINNLGLAADRIFFHAPLAALALYLVARQPMGEDGLFEPPGRGKLLAIGALVAVSMQLKYLLPIEYAPVAAVVLLDAWQHARRGKWTRGQALRYVVQAALLLAGPALLLVALNAAYFASRGLFAAWFYANFTANSIYAATTPFTLGHVARKFLVQFYTNALAWAALLVALLYGALNRTWRPGEKRAYFLVALWFALPLFGVLYARRMDGHHFLQLLPALSVLAGLVTASLLRLADAPATLRREVALRDGLLALLILLAALYPQLHPQALASARLAYGGLTGRGLPHDANGDVAAWLNANTRPADSLLIIDYNPVIYTMVDRPLPTPYPFPIFLIDGWYERITGRSQIAALDEMMAQRPAWVVRQERLNREFTNQAVAARVNDYLSADYTLVKTIPGIETYTERPVDVEIYRVNSYEGS